MSLNGLKNSHKSISAYSSFDAEAMWQLYREHGVIDFFCGKVSEEEFLRSFIKKHALPISVEEYMRAIRENFSLIEGTHAVVEELGRQGFPLALLSDHAREWAEFCEEKFGHHRYYRHVVYSFEVGYCKPSAAMFARALELLGVEPEEALFIDDNPRNVEGAEKFGIPGIVFTDAPTLRRDLQSYGITL